MSEKADFYVVRRSSTSLTNKVIHDKDLSFVALGLLMVSLSLPPNAPAGYRAFLGRGLGEKAVRKGLRELEEKNYRFRFRIRREGQLRELTIISDTPITRVQARGEVAAMMDAGAVKKAQIGDCVSHPDKASTPVQTVESVADDHRAADGAARCDQPKHCEEDSTVPCLSAARWRTAQPKGSKYSSLRSESPTIQPASAETPNVSDLDGVVGVEHVDDSGETPGGACPNWQLLDACLPAPMRLGLSAAAGERLTVHLEAARREGWSESQIYWALNSNPLPDQMRNRIGLVIHRVQALAATPPPTQRATGSSSLAEPDVAREPLSLGELREAAQMWRTTRLGSPEFRRRRLAEILVRIAEADPTAAQEVREELATLAAPGEDLLGGTSWSDLPSERAAS